MWEAEAIRFSHWPSQRAVDLPASRANGRVRCAAPRTCAPAQLARTPTGPGRAHQGSRRTVFPLTHNPLFVFSPPRHASTFFLLQSTGAPAAPPATATPTRVNWADELDEADKVAEAERAQEAAGA